MRNAKSIKNDNIRKELDVMLKETKTGAVLFSDEISRALSLKRRSVTTRTISRLMCERDDLKSRDGKTHTWVKQ